MPEFRARYEFKYLITPDEMAWIRSVARVYSDPDPYGDDGTYNVISLYYDTYDWRLAMQTVEGVRNRTKIRIRTYGWTDDMPVFAEDKSRVGTSICKRRALMPRSDWPLLGTGEAGSPTGFRALKQSHQADYDAIRNLFDYMDLRPRMWVGYVREAYGSSYGDGARLTFDFQLRAQAPTLETCSEPDHDAWQWVRLEGGLPIILELKFNNAFPAWMQYLVHTLGLRRVSCSKYVQSCEQVGDVPWNRVEPEAAWTVF